MISLATLQREYSRRSDGTYEKVAIFETSGTPRVEILIRTAAGRLLRVERKADKGRRNKNFSRSRTPTCAKQNRADCFGVTATAGKTLPTNQPNP